MPGRGIRVSPGLLLLAAPALGQQFLVEPYLQYATPTAITIAWETAGGDRALVEWGPDGDLGEVTEGVVVAQIDGRHFTARLEGLEPETRYFYRVNTGNDASAITSFITPPMAEAERSFRLVAMSDMQIDRGAPQVFGEIVRDGVIAYITEHFGEDLPAELGMALIPGDLVENGFFLGQWRDEFFAPGQPLFSQVPVYPVPGNHELNSGLFWQYFVLPENGTEPFLEHWWFHDHSNLRVIGLDSNFGFQLPQQLNWLDATLADACADDAIDFVFAQLHHPHRSELWPVGESDYTGQVVQRLEGFSDDCGKPSLHFFGHTHGYSRGQSRDHDHLWVNVASAGGNLDRWGEFPQNDYEEFTVTQDEYGFVLVEVEAGEDPEFRLTRISRGQPEAPLDNVVRDVIRVRRHNHPPEAPIGHFPTMAEPVRPDCFELAADAFIDEEGDAHQGSHWQISGGCADFDAPVFESWRQAQNWYFEMDTQAGDDLTDERVEAFAPDTDWCWRVRYRDDSLGWSDWSAPTPFRTGPAEAGGNLLVNPGAEMGLDGWRQAEGISESLPAQQCQGVDPAAGDRYFVVGGLCDSTAYAELIQRVALPDAEALAFGAMMADFNGNDRAEMELRFLGDGDADLGATPRIGVNAAGWRRVESIAPIPAGAVAADVVLMGTRNAGQDNDSYFDEVFVRVAGEAECALAPPPPDRPDPPDMGAPDMGAPDMGAPDMGAPDMGAPDMGAPDMGAPDMGGVVDSEVADAAPMDMAAVDAATPDARAPDDARSVDAAPRADRAVTDMRPETDGSDRTGTPGDDGCAAAPTDGSGLAWLLVVGALGRRRRR